MSETSTETEATEAPTRVESIGSAFRQRAEAVAAGAKREREREEAEKKEVAKRRAEAQGDDVPEDDGPELPTKSWKKDDIVGWLVDEGVVDSEDDVKGLTKDELLSNFFDG